MTAHTGEIKELLQQAREHADSAVSQNDPLRYREAFQALALAVEKLLDASDDHQRDQVVRAVEEFQGDEGI
ncbi:hypothetical protein IQ22_01445 [Pseudomonas duriflava]|uniref:Terminase small subunit n=1 Tax=Pseudomonas duriflava TaxID=459528 RepID=A0A562QFL0_9PSED|nr:hypothetical protein [Pseudomonas duriflava]TWI55521.1 hypothetical protein IQ22_01445 [Pseudomonas duriflava]